MYIRNITLSIMLLSASAIHAQETNDSLKSYSLQGVSVTATSSTRSRFRTENVDIIGQGQLVRAACCNLGESFSTNPSVDVSYSDAATGARQIKLLGLSGTYVQMLTENIPNLRGGSIPYSLGYVPGPWMQSIQVSKGASSVKNGYESTTGQINIEFLKPQGNDGFHANGYLDSNQKYELNADGSIHLNDRLSTSLLLHYEDRQRDHDGNGDGFMDMPEQRQYNIMHRWAYVSPRWISQLSVRILQDKRESGQSALHAMDGERYGVSVSTRRYEGQWKNGFTLDASRNMSLALMLHGSWHEADNTFGHNVYGLTQKNGYAQLMFETDLKPADECDGVNHNIAAGASLNHDRYDENFRSPDGAFMTSLTAFPKETTTGAYAQYTMKYKEALTVMAGIRADYSSLYHTFFTPRFHVKFTPSDFFTLRASAGKGYRTPHAMAENTPLLASGRRFYMDEDIRQEEAWNYGISTGFNIPIASRTLELNAEYYYTDFLHQMVINADGSRDAHSISFENLEGKSYSHTLQVDATYPFVEGLTATAAFRYNDVRTTYGNELRQRPLTSRYKGLLTLSYRTPLELWHFDVTGQLNGHGELYDRTAYPAYFQLQAQVTRDFRHFSVYIGGENLTNYKISNPITSAHDPWSSSFDATQIWGPTEGAMAYIGFRFRLEKL